MTPRDVDQITLLDSMYRDEERDPDTLPEREEQDPLDTQEFRYMGVNHARNIQSGSTYGQA